MPTQRRAEIQNGSSPVCVWVGAGVGGTGEERKKMEPPLFTPGSEKRPSSSKEGSATRPPGGCAALWQLSMGAPVTSTPAPALCDRGWSDASNPGHALQTHMQGAAREVISVSMMRRFPSLITGFWLGGIQAPFREDDSTKPFRVRDQRRTRGRLGCSWDQ